MPKNFNHPVLDNSQNHLATNNSNIGLIPNVQQNFNSDPNKVTGDTSALSSEISLYAEN